MGQLLNELLESIPSSDVNVQIREICFQIWEEEKSNIKHRKTLPDGANIFLALEVPPRKKGEISYVTLERDPLEEYIVGYYTIRIKEYQKVSTSALPLMPKRVKTHTIREHKPKKIMAEFAKLVKFYKGE
jgi:hypothetical protein